MTTAAGLPLPSLSRGRFAFSVAGAASNGTAACGHVTAETDQALFDTCGVRVAFTHRTGGFSPAPRESLDVDRASSAPDVELNRRAIASAFECTDAPLLLPNQVHGSTIVVTRDSTPDAVAADNARADQGCDAVVVTCRGVAALLCFADCLPVVLVAPAGQFAVVHCGWRSTVSHLARASLESLCEQSACDPSQINAYLGPRICQACFEVGAEVAEKFCAAFGEDDIVLPGKSDDKAHINLARAVSVDLQRAGLSPERIADTGLCTVCNNDLFYSYRAEAGQCGRHGVFAWARETNSDC